MNDMLNKLQQLADLANQRRAQQAPYISERKAVLQNNISKWDKEIKDAMRQLENKDGKLSVSVTADRMDETILNKEIQSLIEKIYQLKNTNKKIAQSGKAAQDLLNKIVRADTKTESASLDLKAQESKKNQTQHDLIAEEYAQPLEPKAENENKTITDLIAEEYGTPLANVTSPVEGSMEVSLSQDASEDVASEEMTELQEQIAEQRKLFAENVSAMNDLQVELRNRSADLKKITSSHRSKEKEEEEKRVYAASLQNLVEGNKNKIASAKAELTVLSLDPTVIKEQIKTAMEQDAPIEMITALVGQLQSLCFEGNDYINRVTDLQSTIATKSEIENKIVALQKKIETNAYYDPKKLAADQNEQKILKILILQKEKEQADFAQRMPLMTQERASLQGMIDKIDEQDQQYQAQMKAVLDELSQSNLTKEKEAELRGSIANLTKSMQSGLESKVTCQTQLAGVAREIQTASLNQNKLRIKNAEQASTLSVIEARINENKYVDTKAKLDDEAYLEELRESLVNLNSQISQSPQVITHQILTEYENNQKKVELDNPYAKRRAEQEAAEAAAEDALRRARNGEPVSTEEPQLDPPTPAPTPTPPTPAPTAAPVPTPPVADPAIDFSEVPLAPEKKKFGRKKVKNIYVLPPKLLASMKKGLKKAWEKATHKKFGFKKVKETKKASSSLWESIKREKNYIYLKIKNYLNANRYIQQDAIAMRDILDAKEAVQREKTGAHQKKLDEKKADSMNSKMPNAQKTSYKALYHTLKNELYNPTMTKEKNERILSSEIEKTLRYQRGVEEDTKRAREKCSEYYDPEKNSFVAIDYTSSSQNEEEITNTHAHPSDGIRYALIDKRLCDLALQNQVALDQLKQYTATTPIETFSIGEIYETMKQAIEAQNATQTRNDANLMQLFQNQMNYMGIDGDSQETFWLNNQDGATEGRILVKITSDDELSKDLASEIEDTVETRSDIETYALITPELYNAVCGNVIENSPVAPETNSRTK